MSSRMVRRATASALLAGCLGLSPLTVQAAPALHHASSGRVAAAGPSLLGSLWSRLVSLWAGDHDGDTDGTGDTGDTRTGSGHGHHPHTDEGPGICPHGH
jgi:hypothetical protein